MKGFYLIIPLVFLLAICSCGRKSEELAPPQLVKEIAAVVNKKEIPLTTVNTLFAQLAPAHKEYYQHKKGKRTFLEDLIDRELITQAATKESSSWTPEEIEKMKKDFIKQEVVNKLLSQEFESIPPPTEKDLKKFYDENKAQLQSQPFDTVKSMLSNQMMKLAQNKKREEIIKLLRSQEVITENKENLKYIEMKPPEIDKHYEEPLFLINNKPFTIKDVIGFYKPEFERIQFHFPNVPEKIINDFYENAIGDELIYLEGVKRGYDKIPSIESTALENFNRSITKTYLDSKLKIDMEPTTEELQKFYEDNKFEFLVPKLYDLKQIMFKNPPKDDPKLKDEIMAKAQKALERIRNGEQFEDVAREISEGPEKSIGGDIGFLSINQMVPEFQNAITSMKPGDISNIITTSYGYHIIKLEAEKEPNVPEFNEIEDKIKAGYMKKLWNKKFEALINNLRKNAEIKIFEQYFIE
ncbi:peptidylprolyl isomerase [bacterium]|nr:peptidylprolyl isomerase [bacterium]